MAEVVLAEQDGRLRYVVREGSVVLAEADTPEEALELAATVIEPVLPHELGDQVELLAHDAAEAALATQRDAGPHWREYREHLTILYRERLTTALKAEVPDAREWTRSVQVAEGNEASAADWLRDEHATPTSS